LFAIIFSTPLKFDPGTYFLNALQSVIPKNKGLGDLEPVVIHPKAPIINWTQLITTFLWANEMSVNTSF